MMSQYDTQWWRLALAAALVATTHANGDCSAAPLARTSMHGWVSWASDGCRLIFFICPLSAVRSFGVQVAARLLLVGGLFIYVLSATPRGVWTRLNLSPPTNTHPHHRRRHRHRHRTLDHAYIHAAAT